ncbi:CHAT domain-containing protein [Mycena capillaripes]|nr:CHAT domain-containing protein [Mycena capillaripes]
MAWVDRRVENGRVACAKRGCVKISTIFQMFGIDDVQRMKTNQDIKWHTKDLGMQHSILVINCPSASKGVTGVTFTLPTLKEALHLTPQNHPDRSGRVAALASALEAQFEHTDNLSDINDAVSMLQEEAMLISEDRGDRDGILETLGNSLLARFERIGDPEDITQSVSVFEKLVNIRSGDATGKSWALGNLGGALCRRFESYGAVGDINSSILVLENALRSSPDGHPDASTLLNNLGHSLRIRFDRFGHVGDINQAVQMFQDHMKHTADRASLFNNLGTCLSTRFRRLGNLKDIDEAIAMHEEGIRLTPDGVADKPSRLSNLGNCLLERFERRGDFDDLEKASQILDTAVQLISDDHPERSSLVRNLGNALFRRFQKQDSLDDLNKCVSLFKLAVSLTPEAHPNKPSRMNNYAEALAMRVDRLREFDDFADLMRLYLHAATSGIGPASDRFRAAERWAHYAQNFEETSGSALHAYSVGLNLLPEVAWLGLSITDRHHEILAAGHFVRNAVAAAIAAGSCSRAIEWLEQGRSVIWGQLLNLRTPVLDRLKQDHPEVAERLLFLSTELEGAIIRGGHSAVDLSQPPIAPRYHDYADERTRLLEQIRALEGFDRFLLPKEISELTGAAQSGPVVALNIRALRCDALIIPGPEEEILHVPLTEFTLKDAETLADILATLVPGIGRNDRLYGGRQGSLWLQIVKPVLCSLGMTGFRPRPGFGGSQLLAVAQPSASGQAYLPGTKRELDLLALRATGKIPMVRLQRDTATVNAVKEGMRSSSWVHFACHGVQDISDPTQSALLLAGSSRLMLSDIIQLSLPQADFAFLSACQTATGAKDLQEEAVHLAAGMLLAGYRSVVATMWTIMDNDAPRVAGDLYEHIFQISPPDPSSCCICRMIISLPTYATCIRMN